MKKRFISITVSIYLLSIILLLSGCTSIFKKPGNVQPVAQSERVENQDVILTFVYMDKETLIQLHGRHDNPFLPPPAVITPYTFYTFSVTIQAKTDIYIPMSTSIMRFAGKNYKPSTHDSLNAFWKQVEEDYATAQNRPDTSNYQELIRRNLMPSDIVIDAGESYTGYVVFLGSMPSAGDMKITVPVVSRAEEVAEKMDILFTFE